MSNFKLFKIVLLKKTTKMYILNMIFNGLCNKSLPPPYYTLGERSNYFSFNLNEGRLKDGNLRKKI